MTCKETANQLMAKKKFGKAVDEVQFHNREVEQEGYCPRCNKSTPLLID
jgi:hypothetical protein